MVADTAVALVVGTAVALVAGTAVALVAEQQLGSYCLAYL